jgi:hypothetical protein
LRRDSSGALEAGGFTAATLLCIWLPRPRSAWPLSLLAAWAVVSIVAHSKTIDEAGLSPRRFGEAVHAWRYGLIALWGALALVLQERVAEPGLLLRGAAYFGWCCIQQAAYQNLVYRRIRATLGPRWPAWALSGLLFGLVHLPNPVLVPATALWGVASSYLFERRPSAPALALIQAALSSLLYEASPPDWHHGFRVGPGYFAP